VIALMMEAVSTSETSVSFYQTARNAVASSGEYVFAAFEFLAS
jgi:hypothetical protein